MKLFKKRQKEVFLSPMEGRQVKIEDIPDMVFAEKHIGDGFGIEITDEYIVAPISGIIATAFHTGHAYGIHGDEGLEILLHIGLDTVELNGEAFEMIVKEGDKVKQGDKLVKVDLEKIKNAGKSLISPIIFTSGEVVIPLKVGEKISLLEEGICKF